MKHCQRTKIVGGKKRKRGHSLGDSQHTIMEVDVLLLIDGDP